VIEWKGIVLGGAGFVAAHLIEVGAWPSFDPAGAATPWFLNAGRATAFTAATLLCAGVIDSAAASSSTQRPIVRGCSIAAGAVIAMTIVLFVKGPGTLFPIALAIGAAIALVSSVGGSVVGRGLLSMSRTRRS